MKNVLLIFCLCLLFTSCEETSVNNQTTANQTTDQSPKAEDPKNETGMTSRSEKDKGDLDFESMGKELSFTEFNNKIKAAKEANENWVDSPLSVMLNFTGANVDSNVKSVRSKKLGPGENVHDVMVTVEEDGLMDDSVSGTITILRMKMTDDGVWQVYKATEAWKCWKGRGHQTYSAVPCN